jgi:hypothetical protein
MMAQECPLSASLTLKDTQDGFAGPTGVVWTITPDCSFTVAHQIGPKVTEPFRQGRLVPEQQVRLKQLLARAVVTDMPGHLGTGPPVNARRITLSYGDKVSVLTLPPGGGNLGELLATAGDDPTRRLLGLADGLSGMIGS